ncbi:RNA polymerase II mediator complex subunit [Verticillium nonalfalfae]|uniref:Mediator of RNA polymerase II transcription subunit 12 n=1 Tax=Verticillium nonalfalfae TaxID=1051616 RepID=A0A3M9YME0_9PEZI|nr:RNA polymerase II mediator complex subunit [Verticillium nonalfalfae]RNJ60926.1 RNA polymerase II mediator complex subunit [Verticillium nonalfalfae]
MTSRTPMGVQPRPPQQRTLSSSGLTVQRPPHQRTLSAQYLPPSPVRKEPSNLIDLTGDSNDAAVAQNRYGTVPRRGGSRLKLELSNDSTLFQPATESPQNLTPSRLVPKNDASSLADTNSPASTRAGPLDNDNPPMPMPKRRPRFALPTPSKDPTPAVIATKKDGRPKPYSAEVPPDAPRYAPLNRPKADATKVGYGTSATAKESHDMGNADFFSWTGNHPEDRLSDAVIKNGYFDKAPVTQAETTSAKPAIFPALKHKNGLNLLSSIFVGVLNQRKHNGQVVAPSAFKPPPRVTLTDTKREVWMRDLANPAISLRRLSRTIPHGIRGKGLLDHCLNKNVPTERAVWLVRCVGANDLRTVKRKGVNGTVVMGGEAKWLKDWTLYVEQFVESVASAFGEVDWKARVQYAIRLATHLYAEHLVDRDHYMDWLVGGLENSTQSKLPMWILISQIYWKDLLRLRRHGRRLANALLSHLTTIQNDPDRDILTQLSTKLTSLLLPLLSSYPDNFLSPTTWLRCRETLLASIPIDNDAVLSAYKALNSRNEILIASSGKSQPANRQILIKQLDTTFQTLYTNELASSCWNVSEDKRMIVRTVLEWSTSFYRPGQARIYVAASLLRAWASTGVDITTAILESIGAAPPQGVTPKRLFYQLISELVRTGQFNVREYIIWLMGRGGMTSSLDTEPDAPCSTRLLIDLPLSALSSSLIATRANLLRRAAFDVAEEARDIDAAWNFIRHALGLSSNAEVSPVQRRPMPLAKICRAVSNSSRALQTEVGARLLRIFQTDEYESSSDIHLSPTAFNHARSILEAAKDFTTMAEMIKLTSRFPDADILASCADTVNVHLATFAAMNVARNLCDLLLERMKIVNDEQGVRVRPLLVALGALTARLPGLANTSAHLRKELQQIDQSTAIDACSPVSDNMAARLQDAEGELNDEIERLLTGGTSLDRPTMDRLFHTVVTRLEGSWAKDSEKQHAYSALLARLRIFDTQHFDVRMTDWVHHVSIMKTRPTLFDIYPFLISLGCLGLSTIMTTTTVDPSKVVGGQIGCTSTYMQEVLQLVVSPLPPKNALSQEEAYRFYVQQRVAPQQHHRELAVLIRNSLIEYSKLQNSEMSASAPLARQDLRDDVLDLLRLLVLNDSPTTVQILGTKLADSPLSEVLASITTRLLAPTRDPSDPMTFETVLELANDFTLPFCQLKLSIGLAASKASGSSGDEQPPSHVDMLSKALDQAVETKNMMWTSVLPYLSEEITDHLKRQAQTRLFSLVPSLKTMSTARDSSEDTVRLSESLLSVVEAIIRGRPALKATQLNMSMVEKLTELWELLAATDIIGKDLRMAIIEHWLPILLKFITLHTTANEPVLSPTQPASMKPPTTAAANDVRARMLVVLSGIMLELDNISCEEASSGRQLRQTTFDLALFLVDHLPEESRLQCVRAILIGGSLQTPVTSDAGIRYLFSYAAPWMEQFMLAHRQTPTPPSNGPPRPKIPISVQGSARLTPYIFRRWELLSEPSPIVGENDTALSLSLFEAIKIQ